MIASFLARIRATHLTYPLTAVWAAGVLTAVGIARDWFTLGVGLVLLSCLSILVFTISLRGEVIEVHQLVNSQRAELLARIDTLVEYLVAAGVALPAGEVSGREKEPT